MKVDLRYLGRSGLSRTGGSATLSWSPNLARDEVAFEGQLLAPLRFREAMSALHDVVVSDLRFKPRGREAFAAWKAAKALEEDALHREASDAGRRAALVALAKEGPPPNLERDHAAAVKTYWNARDKWWRALILTDPWLWRKLVPLDPVVTVADDALLFECFSKDESSYGCLSVSRDGFASAGDAQLGVTNVDYSQALYDRFQTLRTYRDTRFVVDPGGFGVKVDGHPDHREEKIDLPDSWLRGFGQLQAAMTLPARRVELPVEVLYAVLRHLRLTRAKTGPRAIRFELVPGRPPTLVLEPWDLRIVSRGAPYGGATEETIRVWGRRRLAVLERLLPLIDRLEVRLLGTGLASIWVAWMGDLAFTLGLSGWTTNNWSSGGQLDLLAGLTDDPRLGQVLTTRLRRTRTEGLDALETAGDRRAVRGALFGLAKRGQVMYDAAIDQVRWRSVVGVELTDAMLGEEPPEAVAGGKLARGGKVTNTEERVVGDRRMLTATVDGRQCEALLDLDGRFVRAGCTCAHHRKYALKAGPCRHLLALSWVRAKSRTSVLAVRA
ncbi:MAG: hypothetical protein ACI8PZ_006594 [Myxococcota bacterium]